jgi:hypothetical protein
VLGTFTALFAALFTAQLALFTAFLGIASVLMSICHGLQEISDAM